jgi:LPXTG-motif cell wall-anchored protein
MSMSHVRLNFKQTGYSILLGTVGVLLLSASFLIPTTQALTLDLDAHDCDDNAVIKCGADSTQELIQKYNNQADVRAIFDSFGISPAEVARIGSTAVAGIVNRDNQVVVNGEVVATGAMTAGRQNMSGSTAISAGGTTFYKRPPSVSFQTQRLKAFVVMTGDGRFAFAILGSCGNPVIATPKQPKPQTQPKPQPTPPAPTQPKPQPQAPTPQPAPAPAPQQNNNQQQNNQQSNQQSQEQQQAAIATAENNVTIEKSEQPAPQVIRVEVPPTSPPQTTTTVAAAPAPAAVQELPKTGMEGTSKTLSVAGLTALGATVAHLLFVRRKSRLESR